jgi:hypothetical protein
MTTDAKDGSRTLSPLTELLKAHAQLIIETSEQMASEISDRLSEMSDAVATGDKAHVNALEDRIARLVSALQLQDVLRQQAVVLVNGLDAVSQAHVPEGESPEDWYMDRMKEIEAAYVMHEQHAVHAKLLGEEVPDEKPAAANDMTFF